MLNLELSHGILELSNTKFRFSDFKFSISFKSCFLMLLAPFAFWFFPHLKFQICYFTKLKSLRLKYSLFCLQAPRIFQVLSFESSKLVKKIIKIFSATIFFSFFIEKGKPSYQSTFIPSLPEMPHHHFSCSWFDFSLDLASRLSE